MKLDGCAQPYPATCLEEHCPLLLFRGWATLLLIKPGGSVCWKWLCLCLFRLFCVVFKLYTSEGILISLLSKIQECLTRWSDRRGCKTAAPELPSPHDFPRQMLLVQPNTIRKNSPGTDTLDWSWLAAELEEIFHAYPELCFVWGQDTGSPEEMHVVSESSKAAGGAGVKDGKGRHPRMSTANDGHWVMHV